ncbi:MAG: CRISPR-associated endoribonuclease Cas6 [Bacteroidia bacterium]|nr:CRISPR-associated endoribonuclease Cas6 [Bacteroidia bacterium]
MRIYIHTTPNTQLVPFNYQPQLAGAMHKWIGINELHDDLSLYSLSWLSHGHKTSRGFNFPEGCNFFISTPSQELIQQLIRGVQMDTEICYGMRAAEIVLRPTPEFGPMQTFFMQSPVLIKRTLETRTKFYFPQDPESDQLMTETLSRKLQKAGLGDLPVKARFDRTYRTTRTKVADYKGIKNKGTLCPVILEGHPKAIAFAWEVGLGNSTGIGFGAVR